MFSLSLSLSLSLYIYIYIYIYIYMHIYAYIECSTMLGTPKACPERAYFCARDRERAYG